MISTPTAPRTPAFEMPSAEGLNEILARVNVAEATARCVVEQIYKTRIELTRAQTCLALLLATLSAVREGESDYVIHRVALELRRLAAAPEAAAAQVGCEADAVDSPLLEAIASHLYGARADTIWQVEASKAPVLQ